MKKKLAGSTALAVVFWIVFGCMLVVMFGCRGAISQHISVCCAGLLVGIALLELRRCIARS